VTSLSQERRAKVERLLATAAAWASRRDDIAAVALVDSWARDAAGRDSDVDLVVLADRPRQLLDDPIWPRELGARTVLPPVSRGVLVERRLVLADGLELDVGIAPTVWAAADPIDEGTRRVVDDGLRILYDRDGLLAALRRTCAASGAGSREPVVNSGGPREPRS